MEGEQVLRMDKMERMQEEMRDQMAKMMEMVTNLSKGKEAEKVNREGQQSHNNEENREEPPYSSEFGPSNGQRQTSQRTYQVPMAPNDPREQEKLKNGISETMENLGAQQKYDLLEERLRAVEGTDVFGSIDAVELNLVPGLVIPPKFKVPDFEKYDGTKCPVTHITMYCRKMAAHSRDDKLLIYCFQDSLTKSAARWYNQLDRNRIHSWKDLARAFIAQYRHVADMVPDRFSLQNMEKKVTESFKEYAQRWRDAASQVQPPLTEKEITIMFINTLQAPYYERLIGNATKNFSDMVISGEIIESAIKSGKIEADASKMESTSKKEEGKAQVVEGKQSKGFIPYYSYLAHQPFYSTVNQVSQKPHPAYQSVPPPTFQTSICSQASLPTPSHVPPLQSISKSKTSQIPIPISDLFPLLVENQYITPVAMKTVPNPSSRNYDPNDKCDYHMGAIGHSIEKCRQLKEKIENLIANGTLNLEIMEQWKSTLSQKI